MVNQLLSICVGLLCMLVSVTSFGAKPLGSGDPAPVLYLLKDGIPITTPSASDREDVCTSDSVTIFVTGGVLDELQVFRGNGSDWTDDIYPKEVNGGITFKIWASSGNFGLRVKNCKDDGETGGTDPCDDEAFSLLYLNGVDAPTVSFDAAPYAVTAGQSIDLNAEVTTSGGSGDLVFSGYGVSDDGAGNYTFSSAATGSFDVAVTYTLNGCVSAEATATFTVTASAGDPVLYIIDENGNFITNDSGSREVLCVGGTRNFAVANGINSELRCFVGGSEITKTFTESGDYNYFTLTGVNTGNTTVTVRNCNDDSGESDICSDETNSNTIYLSIENPPSLSFSSTTHNYTTGSAAITLDETIVDESPTGGDLTFSGNLVQYDGTNYFFDPVKAGTYAITATYSEGGCTSTATQNFVVSDGPELFFLNKNGTLVSNNSAVNREEVCVSEQLTFLAKGVVESSVKIYINYLGTDYELTPDSKVESGEYVYIKVTLNNNDGNRYIFVEDGGLESNYIYLHKNNNPTANFKSGIKTSYASTDGNENLTAMSDDDLAAGTASFSGNGVYESGGIYYFSPSGLSGDHTITYTYTDNTTGCSDTATRTFNVTNEQSADPELYILKNDVLISNTAATATSYCKGDVLTLMAVNGNSTNTYLYRNGSQRSSLRPTDVSGGAIFTLTLNSATNYEFFVRNCENSDGTSCGSAVSSDTVHVSINDLPPASWDASLQGTYADTESRITLNNFAVVPTGGTLSFTGPGVYQDGNTYYFYPNVVGNHSVTLVYTSDSGCTNTADQVFSVYDADATTSAPNLASDYCITSVTPQSIDVILSSDFAFIQYDWSSYSTTCERRYSYTRVVNSIYIYDQNGSQRTLPGGSWNNTTKAWEGATLDIASLGLVPGRSYSLYANYTRTTSYDFRNKSGQICSTTQSDAATTYDTYVKGFYLKEQPVVDFFVNDGSVSGPLAGTYCFGSTDTFINPTLNGGTETYDPSYWSFSLIDLADTSDLSTYITGNRLSLSTLPPGDYGLTVNYAGSQILCDGTSGQRNFSISAQPATVVSDITVTNTSITPEVEYCEGESTRTWGIEVAGSPLVLSDLSGFSISPDPGTQALELISDTLYFHPDSLKAGFNYIFTYAYMYGGCNWEQDWEVFINPTPVPSFSGLVSEYCLDENPLVLSPGKGFLNGDFSLYTAGDSAITTVDGNPVFDVINELTYFFPEYLSVGEYKITYAIQDQNGCYGVSEPQAFSIRQPPQATYTYENVCFNDTLVFTPDILINPDPADTIGYTFRWDFGDGTFSESPIARKPVDFVGNKFVTLYVNDDLGCVGSFSQEVTTFPLPESDFTAFGFCSGHTTYLDATDAFNQNLSDGLTVVNYIWDFGDGTSLATAEPTVTHTFATAGRKDISLTVETEQGCIGSKTKAYFIYPVISGLSYYEDFEAYDAATTGWVNSSITQTEENSWQLHYADSTGYVWQTNANNTIYANNEQSYIESPCFDGSGLTDPVLALDIWRDIDEGADGAILLYSVNGGLTWNILGDTDSGINWYNGESILGVPGGEVNDSRRIGWTGTDSTWFRSRLSLIDVLNAGTTDTLYDGTFRFRMALGTNADNPGNDFDGFGFDNVYMGNKNRRVVLEHFAERSNTAAVSDAATVAAYADSRSDIIHMQYAIPDGTGSHVVRDGSQSARAYYYGISDGPVSVVDGRYMDISRSFMDWGLKNYSQESLVAAPYDLSISYSGGTGGDPLTIDVNILRNDQQEARGTVVGPVYLHTMLVKNSEVVDGEELRNLFMAAVPDAGGVRIEGDWLEGSARSETITLEYTPEENIGAGEWSILVFVQGGDNFGELNQYGRPVYQVHQAAIEPIGQSLEPAVVSGLDDEVNSGKLKIYPVPARDQLILDFGDILEADISYKLTDNLGRILREGHGRRGLDSHELSVADLDNGTYQIWIAQEGKKSVMRQLLILR
ncbi:PKD domain-containing protein [Roseivirga sp. BDSF3-8]|uniref:PKD domain-containing protein n=1 Tax=Roseivirga sp. BDSF3-8 TaxID=3241598 RepID=UPI0035318F61